MKSISSFKTAHVDKTFIFELFVNTFNHKLLDTAIG